MAKSRKDRKRDRKRSAAEPKRPAKKKAAPRKAAAAPKRERDVRLEIIDTLLTTPHRDLDALWPVHQAMVKGDPRFYVHLAAWYFDRGEVRDHKEMFVAALSLSRFAGHRDVGLALLRRLPPFQVGRVIDFIHGDRAAEEKAKKQATKQRGKASAKGEPAPRRKTKPAGLFKNIPRSLKTEVERYLREREANAEAFDQAALHARRVLKRLYALLHIKPGPRAQAILFDGKPPADSKLAALKTIAKMSDPADQARAIVANKIPFRIAVGSIKRLTPTAMVALVDAMSSQELINHLGALRRHGAFDDEGITALIHEKIEAAKKDERVQAFKAEVAAEAAGVSDEVKKKLTEVTEARTKAKGRIRRSTALLCDKSSSMTDAIEVTKRLGSMIASLCENDLFVYAFDDVAYPITVAGDDLASWERAFLGIEASGCTSCGAPLQVMRKKKQAAEQILIVTDEGENTTPFFANELERYRKDVGVDPNVIIVRVGAAMDKVERTCRERGFPVDVFRFTGDYYALPNVIPFLQQPSRIDLVLDILEYPLPERPAAAT